MANLQNITYKCLKALNLTLMHGISVCVCMCVCMLSWSLPVFQVKLHWLPLPCIALI